MTAKAFQKTLTKKFFSTHPLNCFREVNCRVISYFHDPHSVVMGRGTELMNFIKFHEIQIHFTKILKTSQSNDLIEGFTP